MKWKLMLRTLLYGSSVAAFAATVHQVVVPMKAHAEPACCNYEEPNNACGTSAICEHTNDACQTSESANAQGWTCVDD